MEEKKRHRSYDWQFKEEVARLVVEGNRPVVESARGLGIYENLLHTWKRKYKKDPYGSFVGKGHLRTEDEGFRRLQKDASGNWSIKERILQMEERV